MKPDNSLIELDKSLDPELASALSEVDEKTRNRVLAALSSDKVRSMELAEKPDAAITEAERKKTEKDEEYVRKNFWKKLKRVASRIPFVEDAVALYYCAIDSRTSLWVKIVAVAALVYFISPFDTIPDFIPGVGELDDWAVVLFAVKKLHGQITDEQRDKARSWLGSTAQA